MKILFVFEFLVTSTRVRSGTNAGNRDALGALNDHHQTIAALTSRLHETRNAYESRLAQTVAEIKYYQDLLETNLVEHVYADRHIKLPETTEAGNITVVEPLSGRTRTDLERNCEARVGLKLSDLWRNTKQVYHAW